MERRQHRYTKSETDDLTVLVVERFAEGWFLAGEINQNSLSTLLISAESAKV